MVLGLCDRFHCLPSQLEDESAEIIRLIKICDKGSQREEETSPEEMEE